MNEPAFSAFELFAFLVVLTLALVCVVSVADCTEEFHAVEYVSNYDGDTLRVKIPNVHPVLREASVRIAGIDAAEMDGTAPCERERARGAKAFVATLLSEARRIDLTIKGRDKYFRLLADVIADGVNLGPLLVKQRLAVAYDGKAKPATNWCEVKP